MGKIQTNGINLYYEEQGNGYPLVLISGYTTDISAWILVREELAKHFHVYMFDNRGSGRSDSPESPYSIETMADDAHAFIHTLKLKKPHVLAHSMGGAIAQTLAYKYPESINKLVLANTFIHFRERSAFILSYFYKMRTQGMSLTNRFEGTMTWLFSSSFLKDKKKVSSILQIADAYPYQQSLIGQQRQLEALLQFNSDAWFKKIANPTLIIEGKEDLACPQDSPKLAAGISDAKLVSFSDQAHMAHIEKPAQFTAEVINFLT